MSTQPELPMTTAGEHEVARSSAGVFYVVKRSEGWTFGARGSVAFSEWPPRFTKRQAVAVAKRWARMHL